MSFLFERPKNGSIYYYTDIQGWWDFETTPATAFLIFLVFVISWVLHTILLISRRNFQPLKFRSPLLLWISMTGQTIYTLLICLRLIVSRPQFPCVILVITTLNVPPLAFFPAMLRAWRVMFVATLNKWKAKIAEGNSKEKGDLERSIRRFQILRIFVTTPFLLLVQVIVILIHALITAVFFVLHQSKFLFTGCFVGLATTGTFVAMSFGYWIAAFVSTILLYFVKEQWQINRGIYATMLFLSPTILTWFVLGTIPFYDSILERYFPAAYMPVLGSFLDITFNVSFTIIRTWTLENRNAPEVKKSTRVEDLQDLHDVLHNPDSRAFFRTFAVQSFCPEMVFFWEQTEEFKEKSKSDRNWDEETRKAFALKIVETYVDPGGPMPLNLTHSTEWARVLKFMINDPVSAEIAIRTAAEELERSESSPASPSISPRPNDASSTAQCLDHSDSLSESLLTVLMLRDRKIVPAPAVPVPVPVPAQQHDTTESAPSSESGSQESPVPEASQMQPAPPQPVQVVGVLNQGVRPDIFDELQQLVLRDMHHDLYARFKQSKLYSNMRKVHDLQQRVFISTGMI